MSKYIFISNSTKPTNKEYESLEPITLTNVSRPCLKAAKDMGYDVILGVNRKYADQLKCEEIDISFYDSHTYRSIFAIKDNYKAYKNLCEVLKQGDVEVIHCNTPIGGMIGRICGKKYKVPKVIYTAHGFHFFKGASLFNNTILKLAEHLMAHWTDTIITINNEDYKAARKMKLKKNGKVYKVNGVGINLDEFKNLNVNRLVKRKELGLGEDDFILIGVGRIEKNKNYEMSIKAIKNLNNKKIHLLICGDGVQEKKIKDLTVNLGLEKNIHFLGFRRDIKELLKISDCYLSSSRREGLSRAVMEAMASGLPCVVSKIRGNTDLIEENINGFLFQVDSVSELEQKIYQVVNDNKNRELMKKNNLIKIKNYDIKEINQNIFDIYNEVIGGKNGKGYTCTLE